MPNYHNKSKIVKREELIPPGRLAEGMIISFRYSSGSDKTPLVLVLYNDKEKKMIEGINLNYITIGRINRLISLIVEENVKINKDELIDDFEKDITRIQISAKKLKGNMTPSKFYKEVIKGEKLIKSAYRSYYLTKMSSLKAADLKDNLFK